MPLNRMLVTRAFSFLRRGNRVESKRERLNALRRISFTQKQVLPDLPIFSLRPPEILRRVRIERLFNKFLELIIRLSVCHSSREKVLERASFGWPEENNSNKDLCANRGTAAMRLSVPIRRANLSQSLWWLFAFVSVRLSARFPLFVRSICMLRRSGV